MKIVAIRNLRLRVSCGEMQESEKGKFAEKIKDGDELEGKYVSTARRKYRRRVFHFHNVHVRAYELKFPECSSSHSLPSINFCEAATFTCVEKCESVCIFVHAFTKTKLRLNLSRD